ncbi:MAG: polysaccharide biosynthesis C-terminal domain-containing protein, partial [Paracoccaceae bacterium]
WGIDGVALAKLLLATVFVWFDCYTVSRFTKIPISSVWTALFPALLASAGMGILVSWMTQSMTNNGIWEIAAAVAVGVPLYVLLVRVVSPTAYSELKTFLISQRKERKSDVR